MVVIVLHHSGMFLPSILDSAGEFHGRKAVSLFFLLSGFGLWTGYGRRLNAKRDIVRFYAKRLLSLYPLYAIAFLASIVYLHMVGVPVESARLLSNVLLIQSWIPFTEYFYDVTAVGWFMSTLISLYFAFPFICRHLLAGIGIAAVSAIWGPDIMTSLYAKLSVVADVNDVAYVNPFCRLPDFVLGIVIARAMEMAGGGAEGRRSCRGLVFSFFIDMAVVVLLLGYAKISTGNGVGMDRTLFLVPISVLVVDLLVNDGPLAKVLSLKWSVFLGECAFAVYLLHGPVRCFLFEYGIIPVKGIAGFAIYFAITVAMSVAMSKLVVSPLTRWLTAVALPWIEKAVDRMLIGMGKSKRACVAGLAIFAAMPLTWYYFRENVVAAPVVANARAVFDSVLEKQFVEYPGGVYSLHPGESPTTVVFDINGSPAEILIDANMPGEGGDAMIRVLVDDVVDDEVHMSGGCSRQIRAKTRGARRIAVEVDKNGDLLYDTVVLRNIRGIADPRWKNRK